MGLRVRTVFSGPQGAPWLSTLYFAGPGDQSSADAANAAVGAFWTAVSNAGLSNTVTWATEGEVAFVDPETGQTTGVLAVTPVTGAGGTATEILPRATQGLLRLRTGAFRNGREVRGRAFIPGLTELSNVAGGLMSTTTQGDILSAAGTLREGTNYQLIVWSRTNGEDLVVETVAVPREWAILRSRRD